MGEYHDGKRRPPQDETVVKKSTYTTSVSSTKPRRSSGDQKTVDALLNILLMVFLSVVTMVFIYMYAKHPVMIVVASCGFIALYAALILYVVNQVSEEDGFEDPILTVILRWTTMVVLVLSILVALSSLVGSRVQPLMKAADNKSSSSGGDRPKRYEEYIRRSNLRDGDRGGNGRSGRRNGKRSGRRNSRN